MSKPRSTERKLRQRRKEKLAILRIKYQGAKTEDTKNKILAKAILVSPTTTLEAYKVAWGK